MNTQKRTRRKFTDEDKKAILDEASAVKERGGEYKEVLDRHSLASSTLAKWRTELKAKDKPHRNASKASKRKIASKLTLAVISRTLATLDKELGRLNRERDKLLD